MYRPLVSIMMNCYNGEKYLHEALKSILNQTYENWELIFFDNCSTDKSKKIFKSFSDKRLKYYLSKDHTMLGAARKRCYEKTNGELIAVLDTDDIWYPKKLENQITIFKDREVGIVISNFYYFNNLKRKKIIKKIPPEGFVFNHLLKNYYVQLSTLIFRKSVAEKLDKQFDHEFDFISDFDLVLRLSKITKLKYCDYVLSGWRVHGSNDTFKSPYSFVEETKRWIAKYRKTNLFYNCEKELLIFERKNIRQIALFELMSSNKIKTIKLLYNLKYKTFKDYLILFISILPISSNLVRWMYYKRISFGILK